MDLEKLSAADQALLNTDFGEDMEKEAAAMVKMASDCYAKGAELALEIADSMDKLAAEDEKKDDDEDDKMDEESEKAAAELGAFTDRGTWDTLLKLGSERHDDVAYYLLPFVEQKIAEAGAHAALQKFAKSGGRALIDRVIDKLPGKLQGPAIGAAVKGMDAAAKVRGAAGKAKDAVKGYHSGMAENFRNATGSATHTGTHGTKRVFKTPFTAKEKGVAAAKGVAKASPYALAAGGAGVGVAKATKKKEDAPAS